MAARKNPETEIQDAIKGWLESRGVFVRRMQVGGAFVRGRRVTNKIMEGFPDLWGILPGREGRMFVIEVKTEDRRSQLTDEQKKWLTDLAERGVVCIVARSLKEAIDAMMPHLAPRTYIIEKGEW